MSAAALLQTPQPIVNGGETRTEASKETRTEAR